MRSVIFSWLLPLIYGVAAALFLRTTLWFPLVALLGEVWSDINIIVFLLLEGAIAFAVFWVLTRRISPSRRNGWGCLIVGAAIIIDISTLLLMMFVADAYRSDNAATGVFLTLLFGLPRAIAALILIVAGSLLLRKTSAKRQA